MTLIEQEFMELTGAFRYELRAYCYRMLGSVHDAEDLVQEVYLRAWRSYEAFEGRSSLRTWLYRIATNACINALEHSSRRLLPSGLTPPTEDPTRPTSRAAEVTWIGPIPDGLIGPVPDDPALVVASRAGIRLALIAALQHLPARQRSVLILRDVLAWSAAEVADLLDLTPTAVNSALQRARAKFSELGLSSDEITEPPAEADRDLLDRYVDAFVKADMAALAELLTEDARWEMPPITAWYSGRDAVIRLLSHRLSPDPGSVHVLPVRSNGQQAFAVYILKEGALRAHSIQLPEVQGTRFSRIVSFHNADLFPLFDLPLIWPGT